MRLQGVHTSPLGITPGRTSAMPHVPEIAHPICESRSWRALCEAGFAHVGRRRAAGLAWASAPPGLVLYMVQ